MERPIIVKKANEVNELADKISKSASVVVVNYRGLTVEQITKLRSELREHGCEMKVIKNNITKRAAAKAGFEQLQDHLGGPNAIAFSTTDSIIAAKTIFNFAKANEDLELKAGIVDGEYQNTENVMKLAQLPGREALLTMLAGGMLSPLRDITIGMNMFLEGEGEVKPTDFE